MEKDVGYTHKHTHISAIKKKKILPLATMQMEDEGIVLTEVSQMAKINTSTI